MGDASFLQTSFLGGEWSPLVQGRAEDPAYRTGLNVCNNVIPIEEGAAARRPGIRMIAATRSGKYAVMRAFHFAQAHPYVLELTEGHLRYLSAPGLVVESAGSQLVSAVSGANPTVITTAAAHGWSTGDQVLFDLDPLDNVGTPNVTLAPFLGREFAVTVLSSTTFQIFDSLNSTTVDGSTVTLGTSNLTVTRIADAATPYLQADLQAINIVQGQTISQGNFAMLLHPSYAPTAVTNTSLEQGATQAGFSYATSVPFIDGPYFDPLADGSTITPSGTSGSVTLSLTPGTTVPQFKITDIGRSVRLFSEPAAWASGTVYAAGNQVKYNGGYYQAVNGNTGEQPDANVIDWAVSTTAAVWMWATITAFTDSTHVTATLIPVVANGVTGPNLPRTTPCIFRMGVYSNTTGWPSVGLFHEGRLWLAGAQPNRFDCSVSNSSFDMTPTASDGTVADNNAISGILNASTNNQFCWMIPDARGIVCGTQAGEWVIGASQTNDPITPTSIQAHQQTAFGSAPTPAYRAGLAIAFVGRYSKKLLEYITTDFRGPAAKNISEKAKHLRNSGGIAEIAYVREKTPMLWARGNDGRLMGCTYRRQSAYASDPPDFNGWHHHDLTNGMSVNSICSGPNYDGSLDTLSLVLYDGTYYYSCFLSDFFDTDWLIGDALFVDLANTPRMWKIIAGSPSVIRLYGLWRLAGKTVDVFLGGIDAGAMVVSATGTIDVPIDSATLPLLTSGYLASLTSTTNFHGLGMGFLITPASSVAPMYGGFSGLDVRPITGGWNKATQCVDWNRNRLYTMGYAAAGPTQPTIIATDLITRLQVGGVLQSGAPGTQWFANVAFTDSGGYLYTFGQGVVFKYSPSTLLPIATFGVAGTGTSSDATHVQIPNDGCVVHPGGKNFAVLASVYNEVTVINLDTLGWAGANYTTTHGQGATGGGAVVCAGRPLTKVAEAFIATSNGSAGLAAVDFYRMTVNPSGASAMTTLTSISAAACGPSWALITYVRGMFCDQSDGNICMWVSEKTLGTTRLVKVNAKTSAVMWSVASDFLDLADYHPNNNIIAGGKLMYLGPNNAGTVSLDTIDLVAGTKSSVSLNAQGITPQFFQAYNDMTGALVTYFGSWTWTAGQPLQPLNGLSAAGTNAFVILTPPNYPASLFTAATYWTVPAAIGFGYSSKGQILRAIHPQEAGAQNGPALGKTRRTHQVSFLFQQAQGVQYGTDFSVLRPALFTSDGGVPYTATSLFSGVFWDGMDDSYGFDSMICWEIDRPYPATVCAISAFLHTQDR